MRDLKIGVKLSFGLGVVLLLTSVAIVVYHTTLLNARRQFTHLLETEVKIDSLAKSADIDMRQCRRSEKHFLVRLDMK